MSPFSVARTAARDRGMSACPSATTSSNAAHTVITIGSTTGSALAGSAFTEAFAGSAFAAAFAGSAFAGSGGVAHEGIHATTKTQAAARSMAATVRDCDAPVPATRVAGTDLPRSLSARPCRRQAPRMTTKHVLVSTSLIALAIGTWAIVAPASLLASKGVAPIPATLVWVREVGVLLVALGVLAFAVRAQPDSPSLRAIFGANAVVQLGLLPIELVAHAQGTIPALAGIVPNSVLHAVLAATFLWLTVRPRGRREVIAPA